MNMYSESFFAKTYSNLYNIVKNNLNWRNCTNFEFGSVSQTTENGVVVLIIDYINPDDKDKFIVYTADINGNTLLDVEDYTD